MEFGECELPVGSRLRFVVVALVCVWFLGCGASGPSATVQGKVEYKKKPVESGRVVLFPESGVVASGKLGPGGTFKILNRDKGEEIPVGKYKVAVVAGLEQIDLRKAGVEPVVPLKFTSASTTPLEYEFQEGPHEIAISLDEPATVQPTAK